ncbi:unnamed protein product [Eruca vesicaria subsp. sativa]|uniref:Uncharacterized protein n=1 Tax=Eruca vesicaria subsp. sativa TaxID=29727 RepID=A0ABC8JDI3_ERUVS|nr:unnamed protein product [Eruca vesicaria subsp. sativa]
MLRYRSSAAPENLLLDAQGNLEVWFWIQHLVPTSHEWILISDFLKKDLALFLKKNYKPEQKLVKNSFIIRNRTKIHSPEDILRVKED